MCNILHWIWFPGGRKEDINFNMCTDTSCISPSLKTLSTWRKYNQIQQGVYITIFGWIYFIREKTSVNKSINKHALPGIDISWAHFDPKIGRKTISQYLSILSQNLLHYIKQWAIDHTCENFCVMCKNFQPTKSCRRLYRVIFLTGPPLNLLSVGR